ncbi:MAG: LysM peptidoglycan-binding domain-containing protein [Actinomycetota bacterium]
MARTRVRWGRVGALLAGTGVAITLAASSAHAGSPGDGSTTRAHRAPAAVRTYVVRPGDTLWAIAGRLAGPGADPRPVVDELVRANGVRGELRVGTRLVLPG